jgi:gas vesicle protein
VGARRADWRLAARAEKRAFRRGRRRGLLLGAVAGLVAGLLVAPTSGRDARTLLFGGSGRGAGRLRVVFGGRRRSADQAEELRRKIQETRERLRRQMDGSGAAAAEAGSASAASPPADAPPAS